MHKNKQNPILTIAILFVLSLAAFGSISAQDDLPPVEATAEVTEAPTIEMTPTPEATEVVATETPMVEATLPVETPTELPTVESTAEPTVAATVEPTPETVSAPPVINLDTTAAHEIFVGQPLNIQFNISDESGAVTVMADIATTMGTVEMVITPPVEVTPPYNTLVNLTYTAPADFLGADALTIVAVDHSGIIVTAQIMINVVALPTPTSTPVANEIPSAELLITYDPAAPEDALQTMLASLNAVEIDRLPQIGVIRVLVPASMSVAAANQALDGSVATTASGVMNVESNLVYYVAFIPNDTSYPQQWALGSSTGGVYAQYAWAASVKRGLGVTVAVVDSGADFQHPELAGKLLTTGWDFINDDNNPDDDFGHGTQVSGIIAAATNNGAGIAGLAHNAKIMPVKVCDDSGACPVYYIAAGIIHAVDRGAKVINLSMASTIMSSTVRAAVQYATSRGVVVVAAAGNNGTTDIVYPAGFEGVIGVAAHDNTGTIASFSNVNTSVDFSAPGAGVLSTVALDQDDDGNANGYTTDDGTSLAAPHVSAAAALLISANVATTPATVMDALVCSAEDAGTPGYDETFGYGRLKADLAMNWHGNSGDCNVSPPNDNIERATVITRLPFSAMQQIHGRTTVQPSDPSLCGIAPLQTLWFRYTPTATSFYHFSAVGSSYPVVIGVFAGSPGELTALGCSTSWPQVVVPLESRQTYYIAVGTDGPEVDGEMLRFSATQALMFNNRDHQENAPNFAYTGMWTRVSLTGASGRFTQQTSDTGAAVSFAFRGVSFDYVRTIGPDRGAVNIYANGSLITNISSRGAITAPNQTANITIPGADPGSWNVISIQPDPTVLGIIDLDRVRTYDFDAATLAPAISGKSDDRDTRLRYSPGWTNVSMGTAYVGTLKETSVEDAAVTFRVRANALTITRMTGPGFAPMRVTIDGVVLPDIDNTAASAALRSHTVDGLAFAEHVVEIRKIGASDTIQIDSVQSLNLATLRTGVTLNESAAQLAYRGLWSHNAGVAGAFGTTTRTLQDGAEVGLKFTGNDLCVGYQKPSAALNLYFDGSATPVTLPASGGSGFSQWCLDANGGLVLTEGVHHVRMAASGGAFTLDSLRAQLYRLLTSARGVIQENDVSFRYSAPSDWTRSTGPTVNSTGGYVPQGGYLTSTLTDNTTITFYINGSGFILYTAIANSRGCYELSVDGAPQVPIDLDGSDQNPNDLVGIVRYRPLGYGITSLTPGIHQVVLRADTNCSSIFPPNGLLSFYRVEFDGVRVFP